MTKSSVSMSRAAAELNLHFNTFKRYADLFGVYKPNQGLKGSKKKRKEGNDKFFLSDIIYEGKHPQYQTNKLRNRLFSEGLKEEKCEKCDIIDWNGERVSFELNHKDGNRFNHYYTNLEILCPNCHSQTKTYRGRNKK